MTGELNPDLRQPYPNATYTVDGKFHYTTDGWARTVRLEVAACMRLSLSIGGVLRLFRVG